MKFKLFIMITVLIFITACENKGNYVDVGPVLVDENLLPKKQMIPKFLYIDQFNNTYYVRGNVGDRPPVVVRYNEKINRWMYESVVSHKIVSPFDK